MVQYKICSKCKTEKEINEFAARSDQKGKFKSACKVCERKRIQIFKHDKDKKTYRASSGKVDPLVPIESYITDNCEICGKQFLPRGPTYKRCDDCAYVANWKVYKALVRYGTDNETVNAVTRDYIAAKFCLYCNREFTESNPKWLDHIIPRNLGGSNKADNIGIACRECNLSKCGLPLQDWIDLCSLVVKHMT